jgi:HAD superfamily hydrolase (TIGR01458 family)
MNPGFANKLNGNYKFFIETIMLPLLVDLDGVLRINKNPAPQVEHFMNYLNESKRPACMISNSTLSTVEDVAEFFSFHEIECKIPIMTAASAAAIYAKQNYRRVAVYCIDKVRRIFTEILDYDNPQAVIIGDYGKKWDFKTMNEIYRKVAGGADLIAMHKKRIWETVEDGVILDVGPFVVAIEYATGKKASLIGKPSPLYFRSALKLLGCPEDSQFIMIGDELETDIKGAQNLGAKTILIYTGKTKSIIPEDSEIKPDYEAQNLVEVVKILETEKF